jgi:hypothetical protein
LLSALAFAYFLLHLIAATSAASTYFSLAFQLLSNSAFLFPFLSPILLPIVFPLPINPPLLAKLQVSSFQFPLIWLPTLQPPFTV